MQLAILLMLAYLATEDIVGSLGGTFVLKVQQTESLASKQIVTAVLEHLLIRTTCTLLQNVHRHQLTDMLGGGTKFLFGIERTEYFLVYVAGDVAEELAVPFQLVIIEFALTLAHEIGRCREESQLLVYR